MQAIYTEKGWRSRSDKPLYNLDHIKAKIGDRFEVFLDNWETTVALVRTHRGVEVPESCLHQIYPKLDPRLDIPKELHKLSMQDLLKEVLRLGYEGIVLWHNEFDKCLKIKPYETYDVRITDIIEGKGKFKGKLGAFLTDKGKVGTGFTELDRSKLFDINLIGKIIEVKCMALTKNDMFRHPVFVRLREDKS